MSLRVPAMATLPKPRYPARPAGPEMWPNSGIYSLNGSEPVLSASSSLLGLQAQAPELPAEPSAPEPGAMAILSRRRQQLRKVVALVAEWWVEADFRRCQVPVLVFALGVWAMTARSAWQSQESATPLLREKISQINQARARAALNFALPAVPQPASHPAAPPSPAAQAKTLASSAPPQAAWPAAPAATFSGEVQTASNHMATLLAASIRSWFSADPGSAEKVQGNPGARVWVDLKTGLYYCPGARYYGFGGRERGKVMAQKAAEYEYFQPATGAPCR